MNTLHALIEQQHVRPADDFDALLGGCTANESVDDFVRHHQAATWALCGALEVAKPAPEHVVGRDEQGNEITNYAERVDDQLYGALCHLKGVVAPTVELDEARRELWAAWDRNDAP